MGKYINSNLTTNERVVQEAKLSWWSQMIAIIIGVLLLPIGIGALFIIGAIIRMNTIELAATNKRVIAKTGLIRRDVLEVRLDKIESVVVNQSMLGRMLNYGNVMVCGTGGVKNVIPYISNPLDFRCTVNELTDNPNSFN